MALDSVSGVAYGVSAVSDTPFAVSPAPAGLSTDAAPAASTTDATVGNNPEASRTPPLEKKLDRPHLESVVDKLNDVMNAMDIQLKFSVHEATKMIMVKVVNVQTGETVREIPPKKVLDAAAQMLELAGLIVDEKA